MKKRHITVGTVIFVIVLLVCWQVKRSRQNGVTPGVTSNGNVVQPVPAP